MISHHIHGATRLVLPIQSNIKVLFPPTFITVSISQQLTTSPYMHD